MTDLDAAIAQRLASIPQRRDRVFAVCEMVKEATGSVPSIDKIRDIIGSGSKTDIHKDRQLYLAQTAGRQARLLELPEIPETFVHSLEALARGLWEQVATDAKVAFDAERQEWTRRIEAAEQGRADAEKVADITFKEREDAIAARDQAQAERDEARGRAAELERQLALGTQELAAVRETAAAEKRELTLALDAAQYAEQLQQRQVATLESRIADLARRLDDGKVLEMAALTRAGKLESELARAQGRIEELQRQRVATSQEIDRGTVRRSPPTAGAAALKRRLAR